MRSGWCGSAAKARTSPPSGPSATHCAACASERESTTTTTEFLRFLRELKNMEPPLRGSARIPQFDAEVRRQIASRGGGNQVTEGRKKKAGRTSRPASLPISSVYFGFFADFLPVVAEALEAVVVPSPAAAAVFLRGAAARFCGFTLVSSTGSVLASVKVAPAGTR